MALAHEIDPKAIAASTALVPSGALRVSVRAASALGEAPLKQARAIAPIPTPERHRIHAIH